MGSDAPFLVDRIQFIKRKLDEGEPFYEIESEALIESAE